MLINKGYYIPKYLFKRKLYFLKEKVLKRKYGYLFFRKAFSKILPSQATYHYKQNLKKKCFKAWIIVWYQERIEWKLLIKANIHYQFTLQQNIFRGWKHYQKNINFLKLKKQIAIIHSMKNSRRHTILWAYKKWKIFHRNQINKKLQNQAAKEFFKSKYKPEFLRNYFKRWMIFKIVSLQNRHGIQKATKYYESQLIYQSFEIMKKYTNKRLIKYETERRCVMIYKKKY